MITTFREFSFIGVCIEGFFYGLYSGTFVMYLHCSSESNKSRTATNLFYALCLLYVLSTATFVSDLTNIILQWHISSTLSQLQIDSRSMLYRLYIVRSIASGSCDYIYQCIIIYRCWIVWGQNIRVVIIPSLLAIAYLASWIVGKGTVTFVHGRMLSPAWVNTMVLTSFILSMAVNTLVTGLIAFRILKVFLQVKATVTSVERNLGSTVGTKLRHVLFIVIESGVVLFALQLVCLVLFILIYQGVLPYNSQGSFQIYSLTGTHEMFNGMTTTIILVRVTMKLSFKDKESLEEAIGSLCFNNPPSDPNIQRMGTSSVPPQDQERSEDD